ncbi:MAG: L-serine ammonia-lyase, partial [Spirochaetia bacterium]
SIGGGFIVRGDQAPSGVQKFDLPYPIDTASDLLQYTQNGDLKISELVECNELVKRSRADLYHGIEKIIDAMLACVTRGLSGKGTLPGGLGVTRRAPQLAALLFGSEPIPDGTHLVQEVRRVSDGLDPGRAFESITRWISCFALAVNEENAAFGRVVTAPTNGAAGVIPAVLLYFLCFDPDAPEPGSQAMSAAAVRFLLNAGQIGSIFKTGATISAAMGGCQAEIGVSSAMAASALTELKGGSPAACLQAAEIAMEHHLGLTCDPVGGMVQIPCIERNTMGAVKAVTACNLALTSDPATARVSLDNVVQTMWDTACDMSDKYKETSEAGLAVHIPINVIEC